MKIRIIATEGEFEEISPILEKHRSSFDSWRKPQKGRNPKYEHDQTLLQYLEISTQDFLEMLVDKTG